MMSDFDWNVQKQPVENFKNYQIFRSFKHEVITVHL